MFRLAENRLTVKNADRKSLASKELAGKAAEYAVKFVIGFLLSGARILGGLSPFAVGFVSSCGGERSSWASFAGAVLGYASIGGFMIAVKYASAAALIMAANHMLKSWPPSGSVWFHPAVSLAVTAVMSFACDFMEAQRVQTALLCVCDAVLAGGSAYFFAVAMSPWKGRLDFTKSEDIRHTVSVLMMVAVMLVTLYPVMLYGMISLGRILACITVLLFAYKGGPGSGCASGAAMGLAMDAAAGNLWFTAVYAVVGLMAGVFSKQGRAAFIISAVITNGVIAAFQVNSPAVPGCLYEMFVTSVVFALLPNGFLNRIEAFMPSSVLGYGESRTREYMRERLKQASRAFENLYSTVRDAVGADVNDGDIAAIFDAAAESVCRNCRNSSKCWGKEYTSTLDALNSLSEKMLSAGKVEASDLPAYFTEQCDDADELVSAVNVELKGLTYRRQYRARLMNNQKAAFGQYADMAAILSDFASEMSCAVGHEPLFESRLKKYLKSKGLSGDVAVFKGTGGRIHAEISYPAAAKLKKSKDWLEELSSVMGMRLCTGTESENCLTLLAAEPLTAAVGIASVNRRAGKVSGDKGAYFKTDEGVLHVILSDGMGTGREAEKYSRSAVSVLEEFLRSGIAADTAVRILNDIMLLKNQDDTGSCTVDLVSINLFSGKSAMFKYGAAASYLKNDEEIERITGDSMAAGLSFPPEDMPDKFKMELFPGSFAVMVSDGVTSGGSDGWLVKLLSEYDGEDPKELAKMIIKNAADRFGDEDDMTAFVIHVTERK